MSPAVYLLIVLASFKSIESVCSTYDSACTGEDEGLYCSQISSSIDYTYDSTIARTFNCHTKEFCQWASTWDNTCITAGLSKSFPFYFQTSTACVPLSVPVILNVSISCCSPHVQSVGTCASVNSDIHYDADFVSENCVERPEIAEAIAGVADCYATPSFMNYLTCNSTDYNDACPLYLFNQLQTYAKCSCSHIAAMEEVHDLGGESYKFFTELSAIVETEMQGFGNWEQNCPNYIFSCNAEGDGLLDMFEILCPLTIDGNLDLNNVQTIIENGVSAQSSEQVTVYEQYQVVRILMYSESEAMHAMDYLQSVESIIPNDGIECAMNATKWNLNYPLPSYSQPTPAVTNESYGEKLAVKDNNDIVLIIVMVGIGILILICAVGLWKRKKQRDAIPPISLQPKVKNYKDDAKLVTSNGKKGQDVATSKREMIVLPENNGATTTAAGE